MQNRIFLQFFSVLSNNCKIVDTRYAYRYTKYLVQYRAKGSVTVTSRRHLLMDSSY